MIETLYRLFSAEGTLLYIGISSKVEKRLFCQHLVSKKWWPEVERATFEHFEDRGIGEMFEREAIKRECPLYNIAHNDLGPDKLFREFMQELADSMQAEREARGE